MALGISDRMVRKHISMLREANKIVRIGSNKTGHWKITPNTYERGLEGKAVCNLIYLLKRFK